MSTLYLLCVYEFTKHKDIHGSKKFRIINGKCSNVFVVIYIYISVCVCVCVCVCMYFFILYIKSSQCQSQHESNSKKVNDLPLVVTYNSAFKNLPQGIRRNQLLYTDKQVKGELYLFLKIFIMFDYWNGSFFLTSSRTKGNFI